MSEQQRIKKERILPLVENTDRFASSGTYFPAPVAEDAPSASGSMAEPVGGRRVVLVGSRLNSFRRSAGDMSLSSTQSARAAEGLVMVIVIFGSFKVGVGLEV